MKPDISNNISIALAQKTDQPESRFQNLWSEAERLKRENLELEASLDLLVERIKNSVGPIEMDMGRAMRVQIDKLIVFGGRKSLPHWQMVVLDDWIMSNIDCLQSMGLVDDALKDSLALLHAQTLGFEVNLNGDLSTTEQLAEHMEAQLSDIDILLDHDDYIEEADEAAEFLKWHEEFEKDSSGQADHKGAQSKLASDVDHANTAQPQTVFKTLFHRVARALHPDKETDPEKRELKQALMAQLLEARRQHDLMKVFQLYQEHVDETAAFSVQEQAQLEKVLCQFIELESERQLEITTKSELHDIAYTQFYSSDPQAVNRAIAQKIREVERRKTEIEAFSNNVTSLSKLRPYLEDRFNQLSRYF